MIRITSLDEQSSADAAILHDFFIELKFNVDRRGHPSDRVTLVCMTNVNIESTTA